LSDAIRPNQWQLNLRPGEPQQSAAIIEHQISEHEGATMNTTSDGPKDANLGELPKSEREALLDAERRDEMNEHTPIRVDGKKLETPDQAAVALEDGVEAATATDTLKPQDAPSQSANSGATEEQVNRAVVPPPPEGENAPMRKEDTGG
jgi:hypothetical protein